MKFIHLKDLQFVSYYINIINIIRIEDYGKSCLVVTTDGQGIKTDTPIKEILDLIND